MVVYRLVAILADPNALRCVNPQLCQTRGILATELALHFSPFLALITNKKGVSCPAQGRDTPSVLQKAQKGGYLAAFLCVASVSVKRSRLLLLYLSFGFAWALS